MNKHSDNDNPHKPPATPTKMKRLDVVKDEWLAVVYSFGWFCCLMSGYYVLRPIREALGSALGSGELKWLFLATFLTTLVIVPLFSKMVTIVPRRVLIHVVFHFLVTHVLIFAFLVAQFGTENNPFLARVYFVWVTVFGLFAVSVFWSVLADVFNQSQGKRLFGPIASGGTTGAIVGSLLASNLPRMIGLAWLLCISAILIEIGLVFASLLQRETKKWDHAREGDRIGQDNGGTWSGLVEIAKSRYLLTICLYLALISICGTTVYLHMMDAAKVAIESDEARTSFFGKINFAVQIGTMICQTLIVGQIMQRLGLSVALVILPIIYLISFVVLDASSAFVLIGVVEVARRIAVYGITSPSREVLFTLVSHDAKYKSKNFMDTVVIRGCDALTAFVQLKKLIASFAAVSWVMVPVTLVWLAVGWSLGQQAKTRRDDQTSAE